MSEQRTVIQIINSVQRLMRLPLSAEVTEPHAAFLLERLNLIQGLVADAYLWDDLKVFGSFDTLPDEPPTYAVTSNETGDLDTITRLYIPGYDDLIEVTDGRFNELKLTYTEAGRPLFFRIYARAGWEIIVELLPTPDDAYQISTEARIKPTRLTEKSDVSLLDPYILTQGLLMFAKEEQGDPATLDSDAFKAMMMNAGAEQAGSSWGDAEAV